LVPTLRLVDVKGYLAYLERLTKIEEGALRFISFEGAI
jgi:hypothetical protein